MAATSAIDGIISGLNTTEIVDTIIKAERRNAVLLEEEQAMKTTIISAFKALQAKFLALNTELSQLVRSSSYEAATVDVSDTSYLTATGTGRVTSGSYDIRVLSLARNHQIAGQGLTSDSLALMGTGAISIQVGDGATQTITIDGTNNSLVGIKQAINNAKAGVTASIVNDGSASNPYRLVLTANKTGVANKITINSNLVGGTNLNFATPSFDAPEILSFDEDSTAEVSLGTTAAYTGAGNKIFTFTVRGSGTHTLGNEPITLDWSDGTNTGSVVVTQSDTEVELVGAGADGLKLNLSGGTLTGGDTFQVGTFAPTLQAASDARISIGSQDGSGSPIMVGSDTNTFRDLVGGVTIRVAKVTPAGESVTINTDIDVEGVKTKIQNFIKRYNEVIDFIEEQNRYDQEKEESGVLFGDATLWMVRNSLSNAIGNKITGLDSKFSQLYALGIRSKGDGRLAITDSTRFDDALRNNLDEVIKLMSRAGVSSRSGIDFVSSTTETKAGENYEVNITQAAAKGYLQGNDLGNLLTNPITLTGSNNTLKLTVDGLKSREIYLAQRTYDSGDDLAEEVQARIDADESIGNRGVTVEWVSTGAGGYLKLTSSTYGSSSSVAVDTISNSASIVLGLSAGTAVKGLDVAGTINGEEADGKGQLLSGKDTSKTIKGLVLKIAMDSGQLTEAIEGTVTVTKGVAARLADVVDSLTKQTEGTFDRRIKSYQDQVDTIAKRVEEIDERLEVRRASLMLKFQQMEDALGQMKSTGDYLTNQLASINANWIRSRK